MSKTVKTTLTNEELDVVMKIHDKNGDNHLSKEEIDNLVNDYNRKNLPVETANILERYDTNQDGVIDQIELTSLQEDVNLIENNARYAGYSAMFARMFRYLAFTSDFGESFRPVISSRLVNTSYAIAFGYCVVDVAWEGYKALKPSTSQHHAVRSKSVGEVVVERSVFQLFASLVIPAFLIHSTVKYSTKIFTKIPKLSKFQRFGPSLVGLSLIPFLPILVDEPVEKGVEYAFDKLSNH